MNVEIDSKTRILIESELIARQVYLERKVKDSKDDFYRRMNERDLAKTNKALGELKKIREKAWQELIKK